MILPGRIPVIILYANLRRMLFGLLFLLVFNTNGIGQTYQTFEWARYGGGAGRETADFVGTDAGANAYVAGKFEITTDFDPGAGVTNLTPSGFSDVFIMKSDASGNLVWAYKIGGTSVDDVTAMAVDPAGNVYLAIGFGGTIDVDPGAGVASFTQPSFANGVVLVKLNFNGVFVWAKQFGQAAQSINIAALDFDLSYNLIVAGEFFSNVDINFDAPVLTFNLAAGAFSDTYIMEVSSAGAFTWAVQLRTTSALPTVTDDNYPEAITVDDLDNIIVTGWLNGSMDLDPGAGTVTATSGTNDGVYIAKYSNVGSYVWGGVIVGSTIGLWPRDIKTDVYENVYVAMYSFGGNLDFDMTAGVNMMNTVNGVPCLLKVNSAGAFVWSKTFSTNSWSSFIKIDVTQGATPYLMMSTGFSFSKDLDPNAGNVPVVATPPYYGVGYDDDALVLKLSANGDYVDHAIFQGAMDETIYDIVLTPGNNFIVTGSFEGTADFDPGAAVNQKVSHGSFDIFSVRLNLVLDHVWSHSIGSNGILTTNCLAKQVTNKTVAGGSATGSSQLFFISNIANKNAMISSTSLTGYDGIASYEFGGPGNDEITAVCQDTGGNVFVAGTFEQTANLEKNRLNTPLNFTSAGGKDIFIIKYNKSWQTVWVKQIGNVNGEEVSAITVKGNSIYLTGAYKGTVDFNPGAATNALTSAGNTFDIFVMKLDTSGNYGWAKTIGSSTAYDIGNGITTDPAGNVLTTGYYSGAADFDPNAGVLNYTSVGVADIFVLKLTSTGNLLWAKSIGSGLDDVGTDIVCDNAGNVYHTGYFKTTADFDPGPGVYNLSTSGGLTNNDGYIQKLDPNGNHLWSGHLKGTGNDQPSAITIDIINNIYVTGTFSGTIDINPFISQTQNLTAAGGTDGFVLSARIADSTCWSYNVGGATNDNSQGIAVDSVFKVYTVGNFSGTVDFDPFTPVFALTATGAPMDMYTLKLGQISPLPIELLSFTAAPVSNKYIQCNWTTASELNNDYFTVERSKNGTDFEYAGVVPGAGTINNPIDYSFTDRQPYRGLSYYRLKQTDYNGRSSYSEIVAVILTEQNQLVGLPNPANDSFTLYFDSDSGCTLRLIDISGRTVFEDRNIFSGFTLDTRAFARGVYHVQLTEESGNVQNLKLLIQH